MSGVRCVYEESEAPRSVRQNHEEIACVRLDRIRAWTSAAAYAQNTALRVGAAKVDVTPAQAGLPKNYDGILDHIYSRAIVIDNGTASAA